MRVVVVPRLGKIQARFQISLVAGESLSYGVLSRQRIFIRGGTYRAVGGFNPIYLACLIIDLYYLTDAAKNFLYI